MRRSFVVSLAMVGASVWLAACGGSSGDEASKSTVVGGTTTTEAPGSSSGGGASVKDACAALPSATITTITGKDLGTGELETAASSTVCRYFTEHGLALSVEIDPGSGVDQAKVSEEAYGLTCDEIHDIGDQALFCTGSAHGPGSVGEVIWTDGDHTFYVTYNEGDGTPTKDVPLKLANALQA